VTAHHPIQRAIAKPRSKSCDVPARRRLRCSTRIRELQLARFQQIGLIAGCRYGFRIIYAKILFAFESDFLLAVCDGLWQGQLR